MTTREKMIDAFLKSEWVRRIVAENDELLLGVERARDAAPRKPKVEAAGQQPGPKDAPNA